eukprot:1292392-Heterocapsa_arctica.AAC.1
MSRCRSPARLVPAPGDGSHTRAFACGVVCFSTLRLMSRATGAFAQDNSMLPGASLRDNPFLCCLSA